MTAKPFLRSNIFILSASFTILLVFLFVLTGSTESTDTGMVYPNDSLPDKSKLIKAIMNDSNFIVSKVEVKDNKAIHILISNHVTEQTKEYFEKTYRLAYHGFETENVTTIKP